MFDNEATMHVLRLPVWWCSDTHCICCPGQWHSKNGPRVHDGTTSGLMLILN